MLGESCSEACMLWLEHSYFFFNMLCLLNENFVGLHLQNLCLYRHATSRLRTLQDEVAKRRLKMSYLKESPNLATCILLTVKYYFWYNASKHENFSRETAHRKFHKRRSWTWHIKCSKDYLWKFSKKPWRSIRSKTFFSFWFCDHNNYSYSRPYLMWHSNTF